MLIGLHKKKMLYRIKKWCYPNFSWSGELTKINSA